MYALRSEFLGWWYQLDSADAKLRQVAQGHGRWRYQELVPDQRPENK